MMRMVFDMLQIYAKREPATFATGSPVITHAYLQQQSPPQTGQSQSAFEAHSVFESHAVFDLATTLVATTAPADNTMTAMLKITFFMIVIF